MAPMRHLCIHMRRYEGDLDYGTNWNDRHDNDRSLCMASAVTYGATSTWYIYGNGTENVKEWRRGWRGGRAGEYIYGEIIGTQRGYVLRAEDIYTGRAQRGYTL